VKHSRNFKSGSAVMSGFYAILGTMLITPSNNEAQVVVMSIADGWAGVAYSGLIGYCSAVWLAKNSSMRKRSSLKKASETAASLNSVGCYTGR